jgi:serine/threonine protein kinase
MFEAKISSHQIKDRAMQLLNLSQSSPYILTDPEVCLGRGGFGKIVLGQSNLNPNVQYAIKVFQADGVNGRPIREDKIEKEALMMRLLSTHPNIAFCYGFVHKPTYSWIIMELARFGSIDKLLAEHTYHHLPLVVKVQWMCDIIDALAFMHSKHVIHKDLKPANALVCEGLRVKLSDFGIATKLATDSKFTSTKGGAGTPWYMAPEQSGCVPSTGSDVYQWGRTALRMMFFHKSIMELDENAVFATAFPMQEDGISSRCLERLRQQIISSQSAEVDQRPTSADILNEMKDILFEMIDEEVMRQQFTTCKDFLEQIFNQTTVSVVNMTLERSDADSQNHMEVYDQA